MILLTLSSDLGGEHAQASHSTTVCPVSLTRDGTPLTGRATGDASMWSAIATMLATLEFNPAKDEDGQDVDFEPTFTNGLSR